MERDKYPEGSDSLFWARGRASYTISQQNIQTGSLSIPIMGLKEKKKYVATNKKKKRPFLLYKIIYTQLLADGQEPSPLFDCDPPIFCCTRDNMGWK